VREARLKKIVGYGMRRCDGELLRGIMVLSTETTKKDDTVAQ
jgi:hypothetical protein